MCFDTKTQRLHTPIYQFTQLALIYTSKSLGMEPAGAAAMLNIAGAAPFKGISGACVM